MIMIIDAIISLASTAVQALGAAQGVMGLITYGEGHSQQNAAKKDEGFNKIVGGVIIIIVGTVLVPQLGQFFSA